MRALVLILAASVALTGCATKRYGRATGLSPFEREAYTCREIEIELAKADALQAQITSGAKIDLASIAGWLGDFGLGNAIERSTAEKSVTQRKNELLALKTAKGCYGVPAS